MNRTAVFSKTGKGLLEIKNKANRLSKDQYRILNLVDGKTNLADLADRAKVTEFEVHRLLTGLSDAGYIKEFSNPSELGGATVPPSASYADDLDFTTILGPAQPVKASIYQSAVTEQRAREEAERKASEAAATKARGEAEQRAREEADRKARAEEVARKVREEAERRAREEQARQEKLVFDMQARAEAEKKAKQDAERRGREIREAADRKLLEERLEAERRAKEEADRRARIQIEARARVEAEKKAREEAERKAREDEERRRREEEERKRREEEERRRREEEERKRREQEERKRREEEERKRREEEERKRREEEERRRREEEERRRREEEERKRREEEERRRREEEERQRLKRELEDKHRREQAELERRLDLGLGGFEDEEQRRAEEERARRDEEDRRREEERKRREADERRRREAEETEASEFPSLDLTAISSVAVKSTFETDLEVLKRAEAEVEQEFMAKEEAIRRALEEQERRFRMEEEARAAVDRAEREAREKSDREARGLALAAEQARREAEQRAREEAGQRAIEERERRAKDTAERRKQAEEDRRRRERAQREAEQRAREEELARRRKEQEERDRRKAEIDRIAREQGRGGFGIGKIAAVVVIGLIGVAVAVVEFMPLSAYAPDIEKVATEAIGEPVRFGKVQASLFPSFNVQLDNVTVGNAQDVKVDRVIASIGIGGLFSDRKEISKLVLDGVSAPQDALGRMPGWLKAQSPEAASLQVRRVQVKSVKLDMRDVALPSFDADVVLSPDRQVAAATLETGDGQLSVEITPQENEVAVVARGRNFVLPMGPSLELSDFSAKGVVTGSQLRVTEFEYALYGGQGKATATVNWGAGWSMRGEFDVTRVELDPAMRALRVDIPSEGTLEARGRYALQAGSVHTLFKAPQLDASFVARKGSLSGLDLVRALQAPTRETAGGKTKFDAMSGNFSVMGNRYQFSSVRLQAGLLTATGQLDVAPSRDVSGRVYVELRSPANTVRGSFRVTGTAKGMTLKP